MSIPADDTSTGLSDADAIAALTGTLTGKPAAAPDPEEDEDDEDLEEDDQASDDLDEADDEDEGDDDEEDAEEDEDEDDDDDDQDGPSGAAAVADDAVVSVVVEGVEQQLTVGSLKRLAGQEAALTRKSQEADLVGQRAAATIQGALEIVLEDLSGYADVDWVLEGSRMDPEEFEWHREQFSSLIARRDKLINGAKNLEGAMTQRKQARLKEEATAAVQVLSDPTTGIPGWGDELYGEILAFAVEAGLPEDEVTTITNPTVIKLINDARLFRKGQKAAAQKVNLTPKRVRRGASDAIVPTAAKKQQAAMQKLRSGRATDDDAIAALVGRWGVKGR